MDKTPPDAPAGTETASTSPDTVEGPVPTPAAETPKPPEVRYVKESDLSEEARQRIFACLAGPPSGYRSNNRWQSMPRRKKPERG